MKVKSSIIEIRYRLLLLLESLFIVSISDILKFQRWYHVSLKLYIYTDFVVIEILVIFL